MRSLGFFLSLFIGASAYSADIVCTCVESSDCSDIQIKFVPSNPGVYMTVKYDFGERNREGFASVTRNDRNGQTVYRLDNFVLVKEDNQFRILGRDANCN